MENLRTGVFMAHSFKFSENLKELKREYFKGGAAQGSLGRFG